MTREDIRRFSTRTRRPWPLLLPSILALPLIAAASPAVRDLGIPFWFEENRGQAEAPVRYLQRGPDGVALVYDDGIALARRGDTLRLRFACSETGRTSVAGEEPLPGTVSYLRGGAQPSVRAAPTFARVRIRDLYPGIDVVLYETDGRLEYDVVVGPGADPARVVASLDGIERLEVDAEGGLVLHAAGGRTRFRVGTPHTYQQADGHSTPIASRWATVDGRWAAIVLGPHDPGHALVIDPVLSSFNTTGGSAVSGVALDGDDNVYFTGVTDESSLRTTPGALQETYNGGLIGQPSDAFVVKVDANKRVVYATFLGGSDIDEGHGIGVDAAGHAYVAGQTTSADFPTTPGAFQEAIPCTFPGCLSAFVAKLSPDGSALEYSTYLGGSTYTWALALAADADGNAYVAGSTKAKDFPLLNPFIDVERGTSDGFVTKLDPDGKLVYSTYFGGIGEDWIAEIAIDAAGSAYVTGAAFNSTVFPVKNAFQDALRGSMDAFVAKLLPDGSDVAYSTLLGGGDLEAGTGIAVDDAGHAYVAGRTGSADFPLVSPIQGGFGGGFGDVFVTKLAPDGASLVYSTYLGGSGGEVSAAIGVDTQGRAVVAGATGSRDFPLADPFIDEFRGPQYDGFVAKLESSGAGFVYSSLFGSSLRNDMTDDLVPPAVLVDACDRAWVGGFSTQYSATGGFVRRFDTRIICPPDAVLECTDDRSPAALGKASLVEICGNATCSFFDNFIRGTSCEPTYDRLWTCEDEQTRKIAQCTQQFELFDRTAPVATPGTIAPCHASAPAAEGAARAATKVTDECRTPKVAVRVTGTCDATVTLEASDGCGNRAPDVVYSTRIDGNAPDLAGVPPDARVECDAVPPPATPTASDDCDPAPAVTAVETRTDGACPDAYRLERAWTATDSCGNPRTATQALDVADTTAPQPLGQLVPVAPRPPRSAAVAASVCSAPTSRRFRVACEPLADNCDPAPEMRASIVLTGHDVPERGRCEPRVDEVAVACDEVVELRLVAPPCPAKPPKRPRAPVSVGSDGIKVLTAEAAVLRLVGLDRCGNTAGFDFDPAAEPSPLCDEVLADGTCCPAIAAPPTGRGCKLEPCGPSEPAPAIDRALASIDARRRRGAVR